MTEAEAKTKWCPMVRLENVTPAWHKKQASEPGLTASYTPLCLGSDCMMWRTTYQQRLDPAFPELDSVAKLIEVGFCGLAGKP